MRIDFHEKMKEKLTEEKNKVSSGNLTDELNVEFDEATSQCGDEIKEEIATKVWHMEDKERVIEENLKHPEKLSESKAQAYANHFAHEEMNDMENYLQLLELHACRSFLFCNIDMDAVRKAIYEPVKAAFFDKHGHVKPEYVDLIIKDYAERYELEELAEAMDDDDWEDDEY